MDGKDVDRMNDWKRLKMFIGAMVEKARDVGLSEKQSSQMSIYLIDNLFTIFPVETEEELALRDLWMSEDEKGKEALVQVLFSICDPRSQLSKMEWEEIARMMARQLTRLLGFLEDLRR